MRTALRSLAFVAALGCLHGVARAEYHAEAVHGGGTIRGVVKLQGKPPVAQSEARGKDRASCGDSGADPSLVLGPGNAVANAVVTLELDHGKPLELPKDAALDQRGCTYVPHVQALPVGTKIALVNSDPVLHNVHAYLGDENIFNKAEPLQGEKIAVTLDRPGLLQLRCDVHPWMNAYIDVVQTPYVAVTGPDGKFALTDVPPGTYTLQVWHERLAPTSLEVKVAPKRGATVAVKLAEKQ